MSSSETKPIVLAIDDTPENLDVVKELLMADYQVRVAPNGIIGLKIAKAQKPDLILLDVMMPEVDGYEVCRQLKADPETVDIPVIFLTARGDTADQAEGFKLGAADYVLKPLNPTLLAARVKTQIQLKKSLDALKVTTEELSIAKAKMEDELNVGQRIQLSMLPTTAPKSDQFNVAALMRAARQVGGDLYDYFFIDPSRFCVCVADVSDKGVPASLFMAVTKTLLRASTADDRSTASIMTRINNELARDNEASMFVTIFLGIYDLNTGVVTYTNAGHNPPFVKRSTGQIEPVKDIHGPVAGALEGLTYKQSELQLAKGDQLFLFTDGVSEAMDPQDQLFTEERIEQVLGQSSAADSATLCQDVLSAVDDYAAGAEQSDDITILTLMIDQEVQGKDENEFNIVLTNELSEIDRLNDGFNEFAEAHDVPMAIQLKVNMVFDELVNNIISYGYQECGDVDKHIFVTARRNGSELVITVEDQGLPFNPFQREAPNTQASLEERELGGLGIHLVKEVMDATSYQRHNNRNLVTLTKHLDN